MPCLEPSRHRGQLSPLIIRRLSAKNRPFVFIASTSSSIATIYELDPSPNSARRITRFRRGLPISTACTAVLRSLVVSWYFRPLGIRVWPAVRQVSPWSTWPPIQNSKQTPLLRPLSTNARSAHSHRSNSSPSFLTHQHTQSTQPIIEPRPSTSSNHHQELGRESSQGPRKG